MIKKDEVHSLLTTLQEMMEHIKEVQTNIIGLNHESMTMLNDVVFDADIDLNDDVFVALQHQDILTQQLNATSELLEMVTRHVNDSSFEELEKNITASVDVAKAKKEAFSGNAFEQKHEQV
jgi:uncharacterized protein YjgD (DUF1641 family)